MNSNVEYKRAEPVARHCEAEGRGNLYGYSMRLLRRKAPRNDEYAEPCDFALRDRGGFNADLNGTEITETNATLRAKSPRAANVTPPSIFNTI